MNTSQEICANLYEVRQVVDLRNIKSETRRILIKPVEIFVKLSQYI